MKKFSKSIGIVILAMIIGFAMTACKNPAGGKKTTTYAIGDTGPAGGIVFYDKGEVTDGWRYLEAAPAEEEFEAEWGAMDYDVAGTQTGVGTGKENTRLIVEALNTLGETGKAAQLCDELIVGEFTDWFLPSIDELDLMYDNLQENGLGGFHDVSTDDYYWSSSQDNTDNETAWSQGFSNGQQYNYYDSYYKTYSSYIRAVRAF